MTLENAINNASELPLKETLAKSVIPPTVKAFIEPAANILEGQNLNLSPDAVRDHTEAAIRSDSFHDFFNNAEAIAKIGGIPAVEALVHLIHAVSACQGIPNQKNETEPRIPVFSLCSFLLEMAKSDNLLTRKEKKEIKEFVQVLARGTEHSDGQLAEGARNALLNRIMHHTIMAPLFHMAQSCADIFRAERLVDQIAYFLTHAPFTFRSLDQLTPYAGYKTDTYMQHAPVFRVFFVRLKSKNSAE